jgi:hypothetical protein
MKPLTKMPLVEELDDKLEVVADLWEGTTQVQEQSSKYLPKEPHESTANYSIRLQRSILEPYFKNAVIDNVAKMFGNEPTLTTTIPVEIYEDIDEDRNDYVEFAKRASVNALRDGTGYILVEYPQLDVDADLSITTSSRPYWIHIKQDQLLEASPAYANGKKTLGIFRFKEIYSYRVDEFEIKYVEQIREYRNNNGVVTYRIFRNNTGAWVVFEEGVISLSEIPVTQINFRPVGYFLGTPVFFDLAQMNIVHYQLTSDLLNILHMSQVPMLKLKGYQSAFDDNGIKQEITISPNTVIEFSNPEGDASWVEIAGSGIMVAQDQIRIIEEKMEKLANDLITSEPTNTATEVVANSIESQAVLESFKAKVEQAINDALRFTEDYLGIANTSVFDMSTLKLEQNPTGIETTTSVGPIDPMEETDNTPTENT